VSRQNKWQINNVDLELTPSGVSSSFSLWPSKRNRRFFLSLPVRSQKAFISLPRGVVRLILKKISLLLSVTLTLMCSPAGFSSGTGLFIGDSSADMMKELG